MECILCSIANQTKDVIVLEIYRTPKFIISANLYPYNPGHVLIFPVRHVEDYLMLTDEEALEMHHLTAKTISILKGEYDPAGYNIGYNIGNQSGASISHLHQHIIPRYNNEAGFIDIIAGTRLFIIDPADMMEKLKKKFNGI